MTSSPHHLLSLHPPLILPYTLSSNSPPLTSNTPLSYSLLSAPPPLSYSLILNFQQTTCAYPSYYHHSSSVVSHLLSSCTASIFSPPPPPITTHCIKLLHPYLFISSLRPSFLCLFFFVSTPIPYFLFLIFPPQATDFLLLLISSKPPFRYLLPPQSSISNPPFSPPFLHYTPPASSF